MVNAPYLEELGRQNTSVVLPEKTEVVGGLGCMTKRGTGCPDPDFYFTNYLTIHPIRAISLYYEI